MSAYLNFTLLALLDITHILIQICSTSDMIKIRFTHVSELRAISYFLSLLKLNYYALFSYFYIFFIFCTVDTVRTYCACRTLCRFPTRVAPNKQAFSEEADKKRVLE